VEEDVAPDVAPANSSDDDESIEEESDDVDENEEYDADADKESKRQQGFAKTGSKRGGKTTAGISGGSPDAKTGSERGED